MGKKEIEVGFYSDIYSLGTTLLCLTALFSEDETEWEPVVLRCSFSDELKKILFKMIKANYRERYQTCEEVILDLNNLGMNPSTSWCL